jgi:hypothetical protein
MKNSVCILFLILVSSVACHANVSLVYTSTKAGLTVQIAIGRDFDVRILERFVNETETALNRVDTTLKILVFIDHRVIRHPNSFIKGFVSLGYDTLRTVDEDYIFQYYDSKRSSIFNPFDSQMHPLDINASADRTVKELGIKIFYDHPIFDNEPDWKKIQKLIVFAARNLEKVKNIQTRDTVLYRYNSWCVALPTLDTMHINRILEKKRPVVRDWTKREEKPLLKYKMLMFSLVLVSMFSLLLLKMKK